MLTNSPTPSQLSEVLERIRSASAATRSALGILVCAMLWVVLPARANGGFYPTAGVSWFQPSGGPVSDVYSGGASIHGGIGYRWNQRVRTEIQAEWFRQAASPDRVVVLQTLQSEFTAIPTSFLVQYDLTPKPTHPFLIGGGILWYEKEQFEYTLLETETQRAGERFRPGALVGVGYEVDRGQVALRFLGRALFSFGNTEQLRGETGITGDSGEGGSSSYWALGLEVVIP